MSGYCHESWPNATVAPFASGGIDVRSWALARLGAHDCRLPWTDEYQASCDGEQGYVLARCIAGLDPASARRRSSVGVTSCRARWASG